NTYQGNETHMAKRKKADGESTSGYFRKLFEGNLDWLSSSSNDVVKEKYKADFGKDMDKRVQGIMANVKSKLRGEHGIKKRRGRKGRRRAAAATALAAGNAAPARRTRSQMEILEKLESELDNCLGIARQRPDEFKSIIGHLRGARNAVVYMMGE